MNIQKYIAFLTTVETHSLSRAAELMNYTQPGISHMLSSLEADIGFPLLIRTKDGVYPTENAERLLYYMQEIVSAEESLRQTAKSICGIESGVLRIGTFHSTSVYWLPGIVSEFLRKHPDIDLQISEGTFRELCRNLQSATIELALMSTPDSKNSDFIPFWEDPILAVLSETHPLASHETIDPQELSQYSLIIPNVGADETIWQVLNAEHIKPSIRFRVKGDAATISMIRANLGISLMPKLMLTSMTGIVARPLSRCYNRTLGIALRSLSHASPAAKEFISIATDFIVNQWEYPPIGK